MSDYAGMFRVGQRAYHTSHGSRVLQVEVVALVGIGIYRVWPPISVDSEYAFESTLYFTHAEAKIRSMRWSLAYKGTDGPGGINRT